MDMGDAAASESKITIRFFGDVDAIRDADGATSFKIGQMDLFATARLNDRWQFLAETIAESGDTNEISLEVERALIQYLAPGGVRIAAGRYHTAIGYYNNAFHHGLWFQTAASRPRLFAFEDQGGLLPVHDVGLTADGPIPVPGAGLKWFAEIGNGRGAPGSDPVQSGRDQDHHKASNFALISRPAAVPGLQLGVSAYSDRYNTSPSTSTAVRIVATHAVYTQAPYEWLSEYTRIRRTATDGVDAVSHAWYLQAARQFKTVTPFLRYEDTNADAHDAEIGAIGQIRGPSVGLRVDVTPSAALKIQYGHQRNNGRTEHSVIGQVAFVF